MQKIEFSKRDYKDVRAIVCKARTSFYLAMQLMPKHKRFALFGIYAFCRTVDDIADGEGSKTEKQTQLESWNKRVDAIFSGKTDNAIDRALLFAHQNYAIRKQDLLATIEGMKMDADGPIIAPTESVLDLYCECVASAVGRLCVCVFDRASDINFKLATHLGRALQLTNILRDVYEDADMGRLYLHREALDFAGIREYQDIQTVIHHPDISKTCAKVGAWAKSEFALAQKALTECNQDNVKPAIIMMHSYAYVLEQIRKRGWTPAPKAQALRRVLDVLHKFFIAIRYGYCTK